jgi:hypothetical protein
MTRKVSGLLAVVFVVMAATAGATTTTTKTRHLGGTIRGAIADTATPGKIKIAGTVTDKAFGAGAVVFDQASVGPGAKTAFVVFFANGSLKGNAVSDNTQNPDGSLTITNGKLTVSSSGGSYRYAKGTGTFQGTSDGTGHITLTYSATVTYTQKK